MPFITPSYADIVQTQKQEMANLDNTLSLQNDDDEMIRAHGVASVVEGSYQHQQWVARQFFPQTAEGEYLDYHAEKAGLTRKQAVAASGSVRIEGTIGASLAIGASVVYNGYTWLTTSLGTIDGTGFTTVNAVATTTGTAGNLAENTPVTLASAPAGIQSQAMALVMSGGIGIETDNELRTRILFTLQNPQGSGTKTDYIRWASAVSGVAGVYVFSRRRGLGTVDICISTPTGLPSPTLIASVQAAIDSQKPEPADCIVYAPIFKTVDFDISVTLQGITLVAITPDISSLLADYFATLNPADTAVVRQMEALIMGLDGVMDVTINLPASNVIPVVDIDTTEWCRLGNVEVHAP